MKKLNVLLLLVGVLAMSTFSSCTPDENTDVAPIIAVTVTPSTSTVSPLTELEFSVTGGQNPNTKKKLQTLTITSTDATRDTTITLNDETYAGTFNYTATSFYESTETFSFTFTDKAGETVTKDVTITTEDAPATGTDFGAEVTGAFFHISGSLQGAYDLVSETAVSSSGADASKDMINTDAGGSTFTGSWEAGSGNGSMFVKDNSFDYTSGTVEEAMTAYSDGSASSSVSSPANGDIYIVNLRGGSDYAIIQITDVDAANNDCACGNTGKISFSFKKQ